MSTFNLLPSNVSKIESIAFTKNPETNTLKLKLFFNVDVIPPRTVSSAAIIDIAK